jgi:hypothetical protein
MNQILSTEIGRNGSKANTKKVTMVFAICMILFGVCITSGASYALYQSMSANKSENLDNNVQNSVVADEQQGIKIELEAIENKIKAKISSDIEVSYITYKWDDEDETRVEINSTEKDVEINIPSGQHTLTIIAVDIQNNTETKTQVVKGVKGPQLTVTQGNTKFKVVMSDEEGLEKVEFTLNGKEYVINLDGVTSQEFAYPLDDGTNELKVTVYNTNGATETFDGTFTK